MYSYILNVPGPQILGMVQKRAGKTAHPPIIQTLRTEVTRVTGLYFGQTELSTFILGFEYFTWVAFFRFKKDLCYNTIYIYFSAQSKEGCRIAIAKSLCGASPGED